MNTIQVVTLCVNILALALASWALGVAMTTRRFLTGRKERPDAD